MDSSNGLDPTAAHEKNGAAYPFAKANVEIFLEEVTQHLHFGRQTVGLIVNHRQRPEKRHDLADLCVIQPSRAAQHMLGRRDPTIELNPLMPRHSLSID